MHEINAASAALRLSNDDFTIEIIEGTGTLLTIRVADNKQEAAAREYTLTSRDHPAYLDFYEQLANDFNLRMPQNRRPTVERSSQVVFTEVLTRNMQPGMLYGYGDPAVTRVDNEHGTSYYLAVTSNDAPDSFPLLKSSDLRHWEPVGFIFPDGQKPAWAANGENQSDYWAPEIHLVEGEYRVYFVARDKATTELCIGVARSANPEGPFAPDELPLLKNNVIDPHVFINDDGKAWLLWKEDNNAIWPSLLNELLHESPKKINELFSADEDRRTASLIAALWPWTQTLGSMEMFFVQQPLIEAAIENFHGLQLKLRNINDVHLSPAINKILESMRTRIYAQQLAPGGSEPIGEKIMIIENDQRWEAHLVEGVWLTRQAGRYYLFYAGNDFSTDQYGIGVAVADSFTGPYIKKQEPLLQSTPKWLAPGHPSLVTDPDGRHYLFLHAYRPGEAGYKQFRALLELELTFDADGVHIKE